MRHISLFLLSALACKGGKDDDDTDTDVSATDDTDPGGSDDDTRVEEPGPATLTLYDSMSGAPNANEIVLVFDADGEFVEELETGPDGVISAEVGPGWMFVYMRRDSEDALPYAPYLYTGVDPGDALTFRAARLGRTHRLRDVQRGGEGGGVRILLCVGGAPRRGSSSSPARRRSRRPPRPARTEACSSPRATRPTSSPCPA